MQSVYYKNLGINKKNYDAAFQCLKNRGDRFPITGILDPAELVGLVVCDYPELFYVGSLVRTTSGLLKGLLKKEVLPTYLYSSAEILQISKKLDEVAEKLIKELINEHQSEYDKVRVLHDYLKSNVEYDMDAAKSPCASLTVNILRNIAEAHNIVGALLNHKCVCEGFAKAFKFLCDKISIECWVVRGKANGLWGNDLHDWNIVRINGYYHHVDVTWDNQYSDSAEIPLYGYFNLSDEEIAQDHTWNRRRYPACPSSPYNYFRVNNALLDSRAQLESFLYNSFQNEEEFVMFRVVKGSILEREIDGCLSDSIQRASNRCKYIRLQTFKCTSIPAQLTFLVRPSYEYR